MGCQQSKLGQNIVYNQNISSRKNYEPDRKKKKNQRLQKPMIETFQIHQNIKKLDDVTKSMQDIDFIEKVITKHFLLFKLTKMERRKLALAMEPYSTQQGQYVFKENDVASMFFIIKQGHAEIQVKNKAPKPIKSGDFFGQLAILYSSPRSASVKATKKCIFWCLSRQIFLKHQKQMVKNNFRIAKPYVNKLQIFKYLTEKQKDAISYRMNTLKYDANDIIFNVGDAATSFYIILSGIVQIIIPGISTLKLKPGDSFGQKCLKEGQIRGGTAKCVQTTDVLAIGRQDLLNCLGQTAQQQILFHNIIKWALRRSNLFFNLTTIQQQKFISKGRFVVKQDEQIIANQGEKQQYLYICLQGTINNYEIGQIINEIAVVNKQQSLFSSPQTLIKKGRGIIFLISISNIQKQKIKSKNNLVTIKSIKSMKQYASQKDNSFDQNSFKDYSVLQKCGQGQLGKVYLIQNKKSQRYALKCINKNTVVQNNMQKFIIAEKQILELCDYPLISHLIASYKDNYFIYFLLEYIQGGDFFDLLVQLNICDNDTARFYFGCFLISIQYFHDNMIIYRDLKPENAVVDSNGYVHIIDLGTSKILSESSEGGLRTFTIIGTPHYMAPQIFQAKGYSFSADIWSLGIILYEMVCGVLPYGNCTNDAYSIYKEIYNHPLKFPKKYTDNAGRQLILRLLEKNPDKREVQNFLDIKNMDYFKNFSWKLLETQQMQSPHKPKLNHHKIDQKSQYLVNFIQKQKAKLELPKPSALVGWDSVF